MHDTASQILRRVAGDDGPPITFTDKTRDLVGFTVTGRFTKPGGEIYTRAAVIDEVGDFGAGVPAVYHIPFQAGDLVEGDTLFDVNYSAPTIDDYSFPADPKWILRVRK